MKRVASERNLFAKIAELAALNYVYRIERKDYEKKQLTNYFLVLYFESQNI